MSKFLKYYPIYFFLVLQFLIVTFLLYLLIIFCLYTPIGLASVLLCTIFVIIPLVILKKNIVKTLKKLKEK